MERVSVDREAIALGDAIIGLLVEMLVALRLKAPEDAGREGSAEAARKMKAASLMLPLGVLGQLMASSSSVARTQWPAILDQHSAGMLSRCFQRPNRMNGLCSDLGGDFGAPEIGHNQSEWVFIAAIMHNALPSWQVPNDIIRRRIVQSIAHTSDRA